MFAPGATPVCIRRDVEVTEVLYTLHKVYNDIDSVGASATILLFFFFYCFNAFSTMKQPILVNKCINYNINSSTAAWVSLTCIL